MYKFLVRLFNQDLTFRNLIDFFVGGTQCRPLILWLAAQSAASQCLRSLPRFARPIRSAKFLKV